MPKYNKGRPAISLRLLFFSVFFAVSFEQPLQAEWGLSPQLPCHVARDQTLLSDWARLRYGWYEKLNAYEDSSSAFYDFLRRPDIRAAVDDFYDSHATEIKNYRRCRFVALEADARPDLRKYKKLPLQEETFGRVPQLMLDPYQLVEFITSMQLAQRLRAKEMASFYMRRGIAETRYSTEKVSSDTWRFWADSYDFVLAIDMPLHARDYKIVGLWRRNP